LIFKSDLIKSWQSYVAQWFLMVFTPEEGSLILAYRNVEIIDFK